MRSFSAQQTQCHCHSNVKEFLLQVVVHACYMLSLYAWHMHLLLFMWSLCMCIWNLNQVVFTYFSHLVFFSLVFLITIKSFVNGIAFRTTTAHCKIAQSKKTKNKKKDTHILTLYGQHKSVVVSHLASGIQLLSHGCCKSYSIPLCEQFRFYKTNVDKLNQCGNGKRASVSHYVRGVLKSKVQQEIERNSFYTITWFRILRCILEKFPYFALISQSVTNSVRLVVTLGYKYKKT